MEKNMEAAVGFEAQGVEHQIHKQMENEMRIVVKVQGIG